MDYSNSKAEPNQSSVEQVVESIGQKNSNQQEQKDIDQEIRDSKYQPFEKTTYWHQQSTTKDEFRQTALQKETMDCLLRIEAKLIQIENLLEK